MLRRRGAPWVGAGLLWTAGLLACGEDSTNGARDEGASERSDRGSADLGPPDRGPPDLGPPPAPSLLETVPAEGSQRLAPDQAIELRFDQPMDPESVASSILVPGGFRWTVTPVSTDRFRVEPVGTWTEFSELRIQVGAGTRSAAGVSFTAPIELGYGVGGTTPAVPGIGVVDRTPLRCQGAFAGPSELDGAEGVQSLGWQWSDLRGSPAWGVPVAASMPWINENSLTLQSVRTEPRNVPDAGTCFVEGVRAAAAPNVLRMQSAFHDPTVAFDELGQADIYPPPYPEEDTYPFTGSIWGLFEMTDTGSNFTSELRRELETWERNLPMAWRDGLAGWVRAAGEAHLLRESAFAGWTEGQIESVRSQVFLANLTGSFFVSEPLAPLPLLSQIGDEVDLLSLNRAGQRLLQASDRLLEIAGAETPMEAGELEIDTPLGTILIRPGEVDHTDAPEGALLILDGGGDDRYPARVGSTLSGGSVSMVVDLSGNDVYGPDNLLRFLPRNEALRAEDGFGVGFGLFGLGMVVDGGGNDFYRGSVMTQAAAFLGVGAIVDRGGGRDRYEAGYWAQGTAQFGVALLDDDGGDDAYVVASHGQGVGRPRGHGLLLDRGGADDYLALYVADAPELPDGSSLWFRSGYRDASEQEHNLSVAQGVGWGLRPEWGTDGVAWAGGMGALVDLGSEADLHYADTMAMGQGFVYGLGLLYDDGGDDVYRALWWAMGSGTHMGTGLMMEAGGNDDLLVTRVSAALGHDTGVSWYVDGGGNDIYGGGISMGRAYDEGNSFFLDLGGDDTYAGRIGQGFGACHFSQGVPIPNVNRLGVFLDLGGGDDMYLTPNETATNDGRWEQVPFGAPDAVGTKKGLGIDR